MPVKSIGEYPLHIKDNVEKFHGNQLVYVGWDQHLMFCAPFAYPLPPDMPFGALLSEVIPPSYSAHPEWEQVNFQTAEWLLDGKSFSPDFNASLKENGVGHKSVIRFKTPELKGIGGTGS